MITCFKATIGLSESPIALANPFSIPAGTRPIGSAKQIWQTIHSELVTQGVKFTYKKVNENAVEVAKNFTLDLAEREKSKTVVLVIGGNGTLVDVLNGIKQALDEGEITTNHNYMFKTI